MPSWSMIPSRLKFIEEEELDFCIRCFPYSYDVNYIVLLDDLLTFERETDLSERPI